VTKTKTKIQQIFID